MHCVLDIDTLEMSCRIASRKPVSKIEGRRSFNSTTSECKDRKRDGIAVWRWFCNIPNDHHFMTDSARMEYTVHTFQCRCSGSRSIVSFNVTSVAWLRSPAENRV